MGDTLGLGANVSRKKSFVPGLHKIDEMGARNDEKNGPSSVSGSEEKEPERRLSYSEAASQAQHLEEAATRNAHDSSSAGVGIESNTEKCGSNGSGSGSGSRGGEDFQEPVDYEYERKKSLNTAAMVQQHEHAVGESQLSGSEAHAGGRTRSKSGDENGSDHDDAGLGFGIRIVVNDENGSHSHQIDIPDIKSASNGSNRDSRGSMGARTSLNVESGRRAAKKATAEHGAGDRTTRLSTTSTLKGNVGSKIDYLGASLSANYSAKQQNSGDSNGEMDHDGGGHHDNNMMFASNYDASGSGEETKDQEFERVWPGCTRAQKN
ncbi:hypothetical protein AYI70_g9322 [Smittium culicis]|uniref:Uncharacterized protein n=1 Tax=Smittium culicis TaxID=133412 RepID=A0A1R1XBS7_9FUNG|nr:hypothetical protein AYI70_g9322 [Smittium culicis]